jgi:hypothetical protein
MGKGVVVVTLLANLVALFCVLNPWVEDWAATGIAFFFFELVFLLFVGVPVFVHHWRMGLSAREAVAASLDSVMSFLSGRA